MKSLENPVRFKTALKLHDEPAYRIAWRAGVNPTLLSKWITGAQRVRQGDPRVIALGKTLGVRPEECFEDREAKS